MLPTPYYSPLATYYWPFTTCCLQLTTYYLPHSSYCLLLPYYYSQGLPYGTVGLHSQHRSNPGWAQGASTIAEVGTLQIEFRALSRHTGDPIYEVESGQWAVQSKAVQYTQEAVSVQL